MYRKYDNININNIIKKSCYKKHNEKEKIKSNCYMKF